MIFFLFYNGTQKLILLLIGLFFFLACLASNSFVVILFVHVSTFSCYYIYMYQVRILCYGSTKAIPTTNRNGFFSTVSWQLIFGYHYAYLTNKQRVLKLLRRLLEQ